MQFVRDYMARHTDPWNRALHLAGVPLAPVLFLYLLARARWLEAGAAFVVGYTLQWIGHRIEGNGMSDSFEGMIVKSLGAPFRASAKPRTAARPAVSLVTGGTGFVGNGLARALVERGDRVRVLVRDPAAARDLSALGVELVQGDMTDEASLRRAVEGVDRLFHAAGIVGDWLDRRQAVEVNVEGTRRLLAAAADAGVTRAVHVSSLSVLGTKHHYGTDESGEYVYGDAYADTKIDSERVAREFGAGGRIQVVVIRPGFVYGSGDTRVLRPLVDRLRRGRFAFIGDGSKEMNTVYVGDVVHAALLADETLGAAGRVYNITDGRNTTIRDFVEFIADYLAIPPPTRHVPSRVAKAAAVILESAARAAGAKSPPPLNRSRLRFLYYNQRFSIERARRELGYEPRISYREGLPRALDWIASLASTPQTERAPQRNGPVVASPSTDRAGSEATQQTETSPHAHA